MQNPIRGFLHGGAALASLAGMALLLTRAWGRTTAIVGALVFGLASLAMYTVSSLYHSIPWSEGWKVRLQRLDHSMIYLLIAGTYTPFTLVALRGALGWWMFGTIWGLALLGIVYKITANKRFRLLSVVLYTGGFFTAVQFAGVWLDDTAIVPAASLKIGTTPSSTSIAAA